MGVRSAADVVRAFGGRATTAELHGLVSPRRLRSAVARGELVRAARGRYVLPALPDPVGVAVAVGGLLSHAAAARYWGLDLLVPPEVVDVTVPHGRWTAPPDGVVIHQSRSHRAPEPQFGRAPATTPLRTVLDCATTLPFAQALAVADSALSLRFVARDELLAAAQASSGPGRAKRLRVARHADGRAVNAFESGLRAIVIEQGITGFVPQCPVRVGAVVRHVDLGDPERSIAAEADSYAHHRPPGGPGPRPRAVRRVRLRGVAGAPLRVGARDVPPGLGRRTLDPGLRPPRRRAGRTADHPNRLRQACPRLTSAVGMVGGSGPAGGGALRQRYWSGRHSRPQET